MYKLLTVYSNTCCNVNKKEANLDSMCIEIVINFYKAAGTALLALF